MPHPSLSRLGRTGLQVPMADWLVCSGKLGQTLVSTLGSLSVRQDWCSQQPSGYHLLNYYYTNHSYKALQKNGRETVPAVCSNLPSWVGRRPRAIQRVRKVQGKKKIRVTQIIRRLRTAHRSHSLHPLAPGQVWAVS